MLTIPSGTAGAAGFSGGGGGVGAELGAERAGGGHPRPPRLPHARCGPALPRGRRVPRPDEFRPDGRGRASCPRGGGGGGERITVHGDFDVDGVCATAILVSTLRALGAECDWLIPDRLADGYGLTWRTSSSFAERGTELVITVDCGITAVEEVAAGARPRDGRRRHRPPPARGAAAGLPDPSSRRSTATPSRTCAVRRSPGS